VFVSFGLAVGLLVVSAVAIERWVHRPIEQLSDAVTDVTGGNLYREIPSPPVPDFAELGADVDRMRLRILQELDDADRAREALAKRGLLVLALRDELARGRDSLPPPLAAAARFEPAEGVLAGDWWDIVRLDDDRAAVALVDVSGHGAASGVFALRAKQLFMAALRSGWPPGDALHWIAQSLGDTGEQFLTGVVLEVSATTRRWRYANAGHPPMLLCRPGGIDQLPPTGPLLGPLPGTWDTHEIDVDDRTFVTVYTDGLIEARNEQHGEFGVERLVQVVLQSNGRNRPDEVADACLASLRRFTARRPDDDVTLVVLGRE
jgi:sigma-B regulation protein RsbU (phosphoserine phosphatase)